MEQFYQFLKLLLTILPGLQLPSRGELEECVDLSIWQRFHVKFLVEFLIVICAGDDGRPKQNIKCRRTLEIHPSLMFTPERTNSYSSQLIELETSNCSETQFSAWQVVIDRQSRLNR